jgi:small subunit ribosomal protein S8
MSVSDPIGDMLTRIRNACKSRLPEVSMPASLMKMHVAEVLKQSGYIQDYRVDGDVKKTLTLGLKYQGKTPVIEGLKRVSKPSCRIYCSSRSIPHVLGGLGVAILSTSQGILTDRVARKQKTGGEVLCYVW